jgi:hypothetical protein
VQAAASTVVNDISLGMANVSKLVALRKVADAGKELQLLLLRFNELDEESRTYALTKLESNIEYVVRGKYVDAVIGEFVDAWKALVVLSPSVLVRAIADDSNKSILDQAHLGLRGLADKAPFIAADRGERAVNLVTFCERLLSTLKASTDDTELDFGSATNLQKQYLQLVLPDHVAEIVSQPDVVSGLRHLAAITRREDFSLTVKVNTFLSSLSEAKSKDLLVPRVFICNIQRHVCLSILRLDSS